MFTKIPIQITFEGRTYFPGDVVNMGKHPGLQEAIDKALKSQQAQKAPQNKMVDADDLKKG